MPTSTTEAKLPPCAPWDELHDTRLVDLSLDWASGTLSMTLCRGQTEERTRIEATDLCSLECPRHFPWRRSVAIDEIRRPVQTREGSKLEIVMSSGDLIVALAQSFEVRHQVE